MNKSDIFWQTYLNLEKEAMEVSKYIFFTDELLVNNEGGTDTQSCNSQLKTFSPHIADLLVRCCVQIEAISKELYFDNGGTKGRGDSSILFDEDCLKLIDIRWHTHDKIVLVVAPSFNFTKDENRVLKPLKEAHKRQRTYWAKAYQAVKHDRYSSLHEGNVKAFIHALSALYLLNIYYRNKSWVVKYQDLSNIDYSMGSGIFAIKPPIANPLLSENHPMFSESPYVVKYQDADYRRIEKMQQNEDQALNNYWISQPELNDQAFQTQLQKEAFEKNNALHPIEIYIHKLAKYRLNKKIPRNLTFAQKKERLLNSPEWNGRIHQNRKHLKPNELTEDNIQEAIDFVGFCEGMEIMKKLKKGEWTSFAWGNAACRIYIE